VHELVDPSFSNTGRARDGIQMNPMELKKGKKKKKLLLE
jgi:hypothetical protein